MPLQSSSMGAHAWHGFSCGVLVAHCFSRSAQLLLPQPRWPRPIMQVSLALYVHLGPCMLLQIEALLALLLLPLAEGKAPVAAAGHSPGAAELQQVGATCGCAGTCMLYTSTVLGLLWPCFASADCARGRAVDWQALATALSFSLFACVQVALEGVLDFCAQSNFVRDVYLNLDCRCARCGYSSAVPLPFCAGLLQ